MQRINLAQEISPSLATEFIEFNSESLTIILGDGDLSELAQLDFTGTAAFEFWDWMAFLDARECDLMTLRFVEQWEYTDSKGKATMPAAKRCSARRK